VTDIRAVLCDSDSAWSIYRRMLGRELRTLRQLLAIEPRKLTTKQQDIRFAGLA